MYIYIHAYIYPRVDRGPLIGPSSRGRYRHRRAGFHGCPVYFFLAHNKIFIVRVDGSPRPWPEPPEVTIVSTGSDVWPWNW